MNSARRLSWLAASVAVVGILAFGVVLPGCSSSTTTGTTATTQTATTQTESTGQQTDKTTVTQPTDPPTDLPTDPPVGPTAAPAVSTFAPAADLVAQVADCLDDLKDDVGVETEEEFKESQESIVRDANALAVLALALGLHDEDNQHKAAAADLIKAAQDLAAASDLAAAKAALAAVETAAAASEGTDGELKWEKVATLLEVHNKAQAVTTSMKNRLDPRNFEKKADDLAAFSAFMAVVGQASMAHVDEAEDAEQLTQWLDFCTEMRDVAAAVNKATHAGDRDAAVAANEKLLQNCHDCHEIFNPDDPDE